MSSVLLILGHFPGDTVVFGLPLTEEHVQLLGEAKRWLDGAPAGVVSVGVHLETQVLSDIPPETVLQLAEKGHLWLGQPAGVVTGVETLLFHVFSRKIEPQCFPEGFLEIDDRDAVTELIPLGVVFRG